MWIRRSAGAWPTSISGDLAARPLPTVRAPSSRHRRARSAWRWNRPRSPLWRSAYKRPDQFDKDDPVFDVLGEVLAGERTGLLYTDLVRDKKIALAAAAYPTFPGGKYPPVSVLPGAESRPHGRGKREGLCYQIIERLKTQKVTDETLQRVKTKLRASLIRQLDSNSGMADALTSYYANYGDWRKLFTEIDDTDKVTADDVMRVAKQYLIPETRTVVYTVQPPAGANPASVHRAGRSGEMKTLILSLVLCMAAGAQTEVRHAIVLPSYKDLKYPPLPPLKVPEPTEITLSNGMKVLLLENHELPLVSGAALIRTGNLFDPPNKKGLAGITGEVLRSGGTKARTGDQLDQRPRECGCVHREPDRRDERDARVLLPEGKYRSSAGAVPRSPDRARVPPGQSGSGENPNPQRNFAPQRRCRTESRSASSAISFTAAIRPMAG